MVVCESFLARCVAVIDCHDLALVWGELANAFISASQEIELFV